MYGGFSYTERKNAYESIYFHDEKHRKAEGSHARDLPDDQHTGSDDDDDDDDVTSARGRGDGGKLRPVVNKA